MRKRPRNVVKPLPACVDGSLGPYLATITILIPRNFDQSSTWSSFVGFSYFGLKSLPEVGVYVPYPLSFQAWKNIKNC